MTDPDGDEMDEVDRAFVASCTPADAAMVQFFAVFTWIDPDDGGFRWKVYNQMAGLPVSSALGLLELAKFDVVARSDTGIPLQYPSDD